MPCRLDHWRRGHKQICKKIHRGGGAEQYHADKKYKEAVAVAVEAKVRTDSYFVVAFAFFAFWLLQPDSYLARTLGVFAIIFGYLSRPSW